MTARVPTLIVHGGAGADPAEGRDELRSGIELDASIIEGDRLRCGAVGAVTRIAHPVTLARKILEDGRHVLLVGDARKGRVPVRVAPLRSRLRQQPTPDRCGSEHRGAVRNDRTHGPRSHLA